MFHKKSTKTEEDEGHVKLRRSFQGNMMYLQGPLVLVTSFSAQTAHVYLGPQRVVMTTLPFVKMIPTCLQLVVS